MMPSRLDILVLVSVVLLLTSCDASNPSATADADKDVMNGDTVILPDTVGGKDTSASLGQDSKTSDCGGFPIKGDEPMLYCDSEKLVWSYSAGEQILTLTDQRIFLNCCGDHSIQLVTGTNGYNLLEIDGIPKEGSRCDCMCVFDFVLGVGGISVGIINLDITLKVEDMEKGWLVQWVSVTLDLNTGSGVVILDETDVGSWCTEK